MHKCVVCCTVLFCILLYYLVCHPVLCVWYVHCSVFALLLLGYWTDVYLTNYQVKLNAYSTTTSYVEFIYFQVGCWLRHVNDCTESMRSLPCEQSIDWLILMWKLQACFQYCNLFILLLLPYEDMKCLDV